MTTGGIETPLPIVDVEAENRAAIGLKVDKAVAEDAKEELNDRLKQAAEEAKAQGKKTIRTFDMLRKAVSGNEE